MIIESGKIVVTKQQHPTCRVAQAGVMGQFKKQRSRPRTKWKSHNVVKKTRKKQVKLTCLQFMQCFGSDESSRATKAFDCISS